MIWFTSDTHFSHEKIIKYCDRPVKNAAEMNVLMLKNINELVKPEDELYHLGDFGTGGWSNMVTILNQITCKNLHYIIGNHDRNMLHDNVREKFKSFDYYKEIVVEGERICLSHFPMLEWHQMHRGAWMLHGHSHNTLDYPDSIKNCRILDIGVDMPGWNMRPVSFAEIKAIMDKRDIFQYPPRKYEQ
jgi:calcineurin-like phosphoesterase family protein